MEELIYNIQQIINILRKRGNEAHLFFDNILNQLMNSDDSAIELLLKSSAIVQYADFNDNEEYIEIETVHIGFPYNLFSNSKENKKMYFMLKKKLDSSNIIKGYEFYNKNYIL